MFHIDFNRKIFWVIAALVVFSNSFLTYMMYQKNQETIEARALAKANNLKNYFISMRNIYHHQFLKSGLDVNNTTIGFLPANASTFISDKFAELSGDGTAIRNVTDRARNEKNKADKFELEAIEYFKKTPDKTMLMRKIEQNGREIFNFTSPLVIEPYCISCHGKKEETLPSIQKMYDNAYDYKVGDIRGVTSIKIPSEELTNESMQSFYGIVIFGLITTLFLLIIIYYVIRELTIKDVEQKKVLENEIDKLSYYDQLTGLPNQNFFEQHLNEAFMKSSESLKYGAVLLLDVDDFKNVNDLVGKERGEEVLKEMAKRLVSKTDKLSIVSRFGGDKFFILAKELSREEQESAIMSKQLAKKVVAAVKEPFVLDGKTFHLTCSVGIALFFDNKLASHRVLNQAEHATRVAKERGKNLIKFYDQALQDMTSARSLMLQNLKEAVFEHQFVLYYQKQVDSNANVVGVEALIRWQHPKLGFVPPNEFIPLAEESDIIKEIGVYVLNEATNLIVKWANDEIKKEWRISVNISQKQFRDKGFVENIKSLIISKNIDPKKLRIELTESVAIDNQESAMQKLDELNRFGVSISIDDFGTGYSSLRYLKHLRIDELKIDQSFVFGLGKNSSDKTIIKTILALGEEFGFEVIAEGVETKEQFEELKNLGCNYFQGYLFAKPCAENEL